MNILFASLGAKEEKYIQKKARVLSMCLELSRSKKAAMTYSPTTKCSTIGAGGLNFSVRDGKRWNPNAMIA